MIRVSDQQKHLLFDYCIGLTSEKETAEAEALISSNEEAAEIYSKIKASLAPLESLEPEPCPDDLVESTILRLNNSARASQLHLEQLLATEQAHKVTTKSFFWRNVSKRLATAAVFMVVGVVLITTFNVISSYARQNYRRNQCQMQLWRIARGFGQYSYDHDGQLPAVATAAGEPWWKVGQPGDKNHSNTRHIWLLVRGNYVKPDDFVCPGTKAGRTIRKALQLDCSQIKNYNDFPGRKYVTYSFRVRYDKSKKRYALGRKVLMADLNPLFEILPQDYSEPFEIRLSKELLNRNSINHGRRGQNVLFCDGSARFVKKRHTDISQDDIFTLQNTNMYKGVEVPSSEADAFLAP